MSHVFGRGPGRLPFAVRGEGCYIHDADGRIYLDGSGGAAVSCLGHSDAGVREAIHAQLDRIAFAHTGFFTSEPAEELAALLAGHAPEGIDKVYLLSGGSEAVEAAIKLARQYHLERGEPDRHKLIARRQSYHGNTLGALAAGGNAWRREKYAPLLVETHHIAPCFEYRERREDESPEDYGLRAADELEAEILRLGPETVMAFIAEPVVGATAGAVPPVPGYFRRIREICDRYGVLLILDEVMCGMGAHRDAVRLRAGRRGARYRDRRQGGLARATCPLARCCARVRFTTPLPRARAVSSTDTPITAHPLSAAGALAVLRAIIDRGLIERVQRQGEKLDTALHAAFGQHAHVGDIRGRGLFSRRRAGGGSRDEAALRSGAQASRAGQGGGDGGRGLIVYPAGGTVNGRDGDHILIAPPFIIEDAQIDELVGKLSRALEAALAQ